MIVQARRSDDDEVDRRDTLMSHHREEDRGDEAGRILDGYAEAELELRHERTESMIRKAREQFA